VGETLARYGGDEFLVLCESDARQGAAQRLTAYIEHALDEPFDLAGERIRISTSVGAVISGGDLGPDELIRRADQAMYAAKQQISPSSPVPSRTS
jgi:diguanylate cyclase (GGDEF)-like protein